MPCDRPMVPAPGGAHHRCEPQRWSRAGARYGRDRAFHASGAWDQRVSIATRARPGPRRGEHEPPRLAPLGPACSSMHISACLAVGGILRPLGRQPKRTCPTTECLELGKEGDDNVSHRVDGHHRLHCCKILAGATQELTSEVSLAGHQAASSRPPTRLLRTPCQSRACCSVTTMMSAARGRLRNALRSRTDSAAASSTSRSTTRKSRSLYSPAAPWRASRRGSHGYGAGR
jgi:hypothetical protein